MLRSIGLVGLYFLTALGAVIVVVAAAPILFWVRASPARNVHGELIVDDSDDPGSDVDDREVLS